MKKNEKVPGMTETKPNREQRRHPEKFQQPENETLSRSTDMQDELLEQGNQDVTSARAKNSGHGKKTADKWNQ
jgi:hypothetical protein